MPEKELILVRNVDEKSIASSRTIAHVFDKRHSDVLRAIDDHDISQEFRERNFTLSSYQSAQNKEQPKYLMTRDGWSLIVMSFTGKKATEWKEKFITAFNAMEKKLRELIEKKQAKLPDFTNPAESAEAWAKQYREKEAAKKELAEAKPQIEFAKAIEKSEDSISVGEMAKILCDDKFNIGQNSLFKELRNLKLIFRNSQGKNEPYQSSIKAGWFKYNEFSKEVTRKSDGKKIIKLCHKIKITSKGQIYISNKLIGSKEVVKCG